MTATVATRLGRLESKRGDPDHGPPVVCLTRDGVRTCSGKIDAEVARASLVVNLVRRDGPNPNRGGGAA